MLVSMGTLALRDEIDKPEPLSRSMLRDEGSESRIGATSLLFHRPKAYSAKDRVKLERAAGLCHIKSGFHPDTTIRVEYEYPEWGTDVCGRSHSSRRLDGAFDAGLSSQRRESWLAFHHLPAVMPRLPV
jgi:hypothetical protein